MTRFVTQQEPLISLNHRASLHAREHEDQARRTQLRKPITSVPLTGTGAVFIYRCVVEDAEIEEKGEGCSKNSYCKLLCSSYLFN